MFSCPKSNSCSEGLPCVEGQKSTELWKGITYTIHISNTNLNLIQLNPDRSHPHSKLLATVHHPFSAPIARGKNHQPFWPESGELSMADSCFAVTGSFLNCSAICQAAAKGTATTSLHQPLPICYSSSPKMQLRNSLFNSFKILCFRLLYPCKKLALHSRWYYCCCT